MVWHDHEIGNRYAWEAAVHRHQQRLHGLAAGQQRRARALVYEARKSRDSPFNRHCDEEELFAGMSELQFHVQESLSEKRFVCKNPKPRAVRRSCRDPRPEPLRRVLRLLVEN